MLTTWVFAAILAEAMVGQINQSNQVTQSKPVTQSNQTILVPLSSATMTCTREGDHLVCVIPLDKEVTLEPPQAPSLAPKVRAYRPSRQTLVLSGPEVSAQLQVAEANIALAKSLLPKASTPEEAVFAQQLLYWSNEQYRTVSALLPTVPGDLQLAPDPFDDDHQVIDADTLVLCRSESDAPDGCSSAAH